MTHYALIIFYVSLAIAAIFLIARDYCARKYKDDLAELERWRIGQLGGRQWLVEFPDAVVALDLLRGIAKGRIANDWEEARDVMRLAKDSEK